MKKIFYRAIRRDDKIIYKSDTGYLYTVKTPAGFDVDMFIARDENLKNKNLWNVTHGASGMLATLTAYTTKKAAIQALNENKYICVLDRLLNTPYIKKYTALLSEYITAQEVK